MTTRTRTLAAGALAAVATAVTIPALTGAQTSGAREITVREKVRSVALVHQNSHNKSDTLASGDSVVTLQALSSPEGAALGTLRTDCTNIGKKAPVFKATMQCLTTYRLNDGQVIAAGVVTLSSTDGLQFPIVGGSGAYAGANGYVSSGTPVKGYDTVDILHIAG